MDKNIYQVLNYGDDKWLVAIIIGTNNENVKDLLKTRELNIENISINLVGVSQKGEQILAVEILENNGV